MPSPQPLPLRGGGAYRNGFALPTAIFLLVVMGSLAAWLSRLTESTLAQDALELEGERAWLAAQAGLEAGLYAATHAGVCAQTVTFASGSQLERFPATVACASSTADEGGATVTLIQITSVACNQPASGVCPNPAPPSPEYVERRVQATVEP
ncbi:MAG: agglutinin biogenesis protein MshP [Betaproteobacteria bacterium]|nr:agglutinin biogenesis protein MshP [Betaproteobacteria bacterium]